MSEDIPKQLTCKLFCMVLGGSMPSILREAYVCEDTGCVNIMTAGCDSVKGKSDTVNMVLIPNKSAYEDGGWPEVLPVPVAHEILVGTLEQILEYQKGLIIKAAKQTLVDSLKDGPELAAESNQTIRKIYDNRWSDIYVQYVGDGEIHDKLADAMVGQKNYKETNEDQDDNKQEPGG